MALEIERKYLIKDKTIIKDALVSDHIKQGYLTNVDTKTIVRVRILNGIIGVLTIKGPTTNITRTEIEFPIHIHDAQQLMILCDEIIEKKRFEIKVDNHTWFIDKFIGLNQGLWVAEIELENELTTFIKPEWLGAEVSYNIRYFNSVLSRDPFTQWNINALETHHLGEQ